MAGLSYLPANQVNKGSFLVEPDGCLFEVIHVEEQKGLVRIELNVDNFLAIPQHVLTLKPDHILTVAIL